jgi:hypothetical protein
MKKILLLLALSGTTGTLVAQNTKTIKPSDYSFSGKLSQPFKADTLWRNKLPNTSTNNFFKQGLINLDKLKIDQYDKLHSSLLIASEGYNMPIAKLKGSSKMPVILLEGNSKMPVVGKALKLLNNTVLVNP